MEGNQLDYIPAENNDLHAPFLQYEEIDLWLERQSSRTVFVLQIKYWKSQVNFVPNNDKIRGDWRYLSSSTFNSQFTRTRGREYLSSCTFNSIEMNKAKNGRKLVGNRVWFAEIYIFVHGVTIWFAILLNSSADFKNWDTHSGCRAIMSHVLPCGYLYVALLIVSSD